MNTQKLFNAEFKIKSLSMSFNFDREVEDTIQKYCNAAKIMQFGSLTQWEETNSRLEWAADDALHFVENNPVSYNCAPGNSQYWHKFAELLHDVYRTSEADAADFLISDEADKCNKLGDEAEKRGNKADEVLCNPGRRHSSTLEALEDESQEAHELAAYMYEEGTKYNDMAEALAEAVENIEALVENVDAMAELMAEWDRLKDEEAAEVLAAIRAEKQAQEVKPAHVQDDETAIAAHFEDLAANAPAEDVEAVKPQKDTKEWPEGLKVTENEYIFGRVGKSAWVNYIVVSEYMNDNTPQIFIQHHGPQKNAIKYLCDNLSVEVQRGRTCHWNKEKTMWEGRLFLYNGTNDDGSLNIIACARMTTARRDKMAELLLNAWWSRSDLNPRNYTHRHAAALPAPAEAAVETVEATAAAEVVPVAEDLTACAPASQKTEQKPTTPSVKKFNWDDVPEDEQHHEPDFYKGIKKIAEESKMEYIDAYKLSADSMAEVMNEQPDVWRGVVPGVFLWLEDTGLKQDSAQNIGGVIDEFVYCNGKKDYLHKRLAMVEKIIDCTDEDLQLLKYCDELPEGCSRGGGRCDDEEAQARALEVMQKTNSKAAREKYYSYWFTCVTMLRSKNYCVFIDAEGYTWCRYVLLLPSWREMFADEVQKAEEAERQRKEAEAADEFLQEVKAQMAYTADCDKIRPYMVADLSSLELHDRQGRQNGRRKNIMAVLRHYFPGQKFGVKYRYASHNDIEISWIDGPTVEEVEKCCNWSIFCDTWRHFDGMDDSWDYGSRKFTEFAEKYGGGQLDRIEFERGFNSSRRAEVEEHVRELFTACGVEVHEYHQSTAEFRQIVSAVHQQYGQQAADFAGRYYWLSVCDVARAIMYTNADKLAA